MNISKFDINKDIEERITYLEEQKEELEKELSKMPEGSLLVAPGSTKNSFRYYLRMSSKDKMGVYLDRSKFADKMKYAKKKYLKELAKNIDGEIGKLEKVKRLHISDSVMDTYLEMNLGIKKLIKPINVDDDTYARLWKSVTYKGLGFDENDTSSFYSDRGERMRSKSEVLIANALNRMKIPYNYEQPIARKNGELLYPDFAILDVKRRRTVYLEHLGKMDDMSYVSRNIWKLNEYKKIDIYLGVNLFLTYENSSNALGTDEIYKIIQHIIGD